MIRRIAYIVIILLCASCSLFAGNVKVAVREPALYYKPLQVFQDTSKKAKQQQEEEKNKIKEISKARRQVKPEKIDETGVVVPVPKSRRRPAGVERPPEIPRRNND